MTKISDDGNLYGKFYTGEQSATNTAQKEAITNIELSKQQTEFIRYKQDCRKRAFDMAHTELMQWKNNGAMAEDQPDVQTIANKYYKWLTEI